MFVYDKKLQFPVKIDRPNPRLASVIISQYGGPDGELGASLRYLSQRYSMPFDELKGLLKKSMIIIGICSVGMLGLGFALAKPLSVLFVGYDAELLELTVEGFYIFAVSFLFVGFAIFFSGFFTALNDGLTSAIISFLRTLVFQIAAVLLLPLIWGIDGIWWSIVVAEAMAVIFGSIFLIAKQKKYQY